VNFLFIIILINMSRCHKNIIKQLLQQQIRMISVADHVTLKKV